MLGVPIALLRASMQLAATALLVLNSLMADLIDPRKTGASRNNLCAGPIHATRGSQELFASDASSAPARRCFRRPLAGLVRHVTVGKETNYCL